MDLSLFFFIYENIVSVFYIFRRYFGERREGEIYLKFWYFFKKNRLIYLKNIVLEYRIGLRLEDWSKFGLLYYRWMGVY